MLEHFTWPQFLIAALILSLLWYIAIVLLYFRKDLKILLLGKEFNLQNEPLPHAWQDEVDEIPADNLMGKPAKPEGLENVTMNGFGFSPKDNSSKFLQLGVVPDVLEELKTIFNILQKEDGSKSDFFSLLALTKAKHAGIGRNPNISHINDFVRENAPFMLTKEELENMWD
ncbi:hypothetical protein [Daejeonella oryzae]|uniref:hypothetical protein n=1 Tax=Daejeonella oryzae TaxID=1122943 RepID=UPI00047CED43|nr:hypothetical protein [Daejeonella oryzae]